MIEVACFYSPVEADLARLLLDSHGIDSFLLDTQMSNFFGGAMTPVRLLVIEEDYREAKAILAEDRLANRATNAPPAQAEPRPVRAPIQFLARDAIFALRHRPCQRRSIARPAERHHLAVSDRANRLAHGLDVGRAHPADDRDVTIF